MPTPSSLQLSKGCVRTPWGWARECPHSLRGPWKTSTFPPPDLGVPPTHKPVYLDIDPGQVAGAVLSGHGRAHICLPNDLVAGDAAQWLLALGPVADGCLTPRNQRWWRKCPDL